MTHRSRRPWCAWLVAGSLGLAAGPGGGAAWGGEAPSPGGLAPEAPGVAYARVEAEVKGHLKEHARDALRSDCARLVRLAAECADPTVRGKYRALLGAILQGERADEVQKVALKAIGETQDPALFRYLRPHLAMPNVKEAPPLLETAIEATGRLAADEGAHVLLGIVKESKVLPICQAAMKALANYGANKRTRAKIVGDLVATVRKDRPGVGSRADTSTGQVIPTARTRTGDEAQSRWQALAPVLVETLNKLTGQGCGSAEDWFDLWDAYKSQPQTLFPSRE